jgi:RNA polymerase sigma-70 factor (ECF subfamily)
MSDAEMVRRILGGEIELFEELYHRYERAVFGCVFGISRNPELAREQAMDVWAAVYEKLSGFDPTRSFRPWVVGFARNLALYARRGKLSEREWVPLADMLPGQEPSCPGPAEEHEHRLRDERLYQELDRLTGKQRVAVVAHCAEGESFRSIGLRTNQRLKAVSSAAHRGLSVLRRAYGVDESKLKEQRRNRKHESSV